jgi:ABC-type oligopeptide transport system ATPase subunit
MMSKLVSEQRESNRLLRKMAGENDHEASRANLLKSPSKPIFQALQKSMPLSTNSPQKEAEDECDRSEEGSIICSSPFRYVSDCLKEKEEPSELQVLNEKTDKVVSSLEGLGEILKRI